jgi:hypothetical protein
MKPPTAWNEYLALRKMGDMVRDYETAEDEEPRLMMEYMSAFRQFCGDMNDSRVRLALEAARAALAKKFPPANWDVRHVKRIALVKDMPTRVINAFETEYRRIFNLCNRLLDFSRTCED